MDVKPMKMMMMMMYKLLYSIFIFMTSGQDELAERSPRTTAIEGQSSSAEFSRCSGSTR